jgi:signal transduction histidine kinase
MLEPLKSSPALFLRRNSLRAFRGALPLGLAALLLLIPTFALFAGQLALTKDENIPDTQTAYNNPTNGLGSWIWAATTSDRQTCQLWRAFDIPANTVVTEARLLMTVDNEFTLYLDGRELGHGTEWRELYDFNLAPLLQPGRHVLAVSAFNSSWYAGMVFGLHITSAEGQVIEIKSGEKWKIVPEGTRGWETTTEPDASWPSATVVAELGEKPWWKVPENLNKMPTLEPLKIYFWQTGWFQIILLTLCGLVVLFSFQLMAQLALHEKERRLLQEERARIARDIHDDLGSRMTQLVLHGEVAQSELPPASCTRQQLNRICEEAREILSTMDEILWAVNPRRDTLHEFTSYVCGFAQEFLKPTHIQCLLEVDADMSKAAFDLPVRRSLLMAIKETLNNAVKHSAATELLLQIHMQGQKLCVAVQDNGRGFNQSELKSSGNGLLNMTQRMNEFGGTCRVTTEPGKGCRVEFGVPLPRKQTPRWNWSWKKISQRFQRNDDPLLPETIKTNDSVRS